jgi:LytR cell envelope-related transcriptional attenuator
VRGWWDRTWPSLVALIGTLAVVGALLLFFGRETDSPETTSAAGSTEAATESPGVRDSTAAPQPSASAMKAPVLVLNASSVDGLAARTEEALLDAGWPVAGTENWSSDVESTTLFYPEKLLPAAQTLARAFPQIKELSPAQDGMSTDELTLVLTGDVDLSKHP